MITWLGPDDFREMPWANGKGTTLELARQDRGGALLWRLSRARVVEEGDFSILPGIERNLTVLTGPGFELVGQGLRLQARPMQPVAFPGDLALRAVNVSAPSDDFNVMTARSLGKPRVQVLQSGSTLPVPGALAAVYLPKANRLILTDEPMPLPDEGPAIVVFFPAMTGD